MPISPPDSRLPSPDVTTAAARAAAARRAGRSQTLMESSQNIMSDADSQTAGRSDTPITPTHRITSMGSVDSEGSWFASGAKRYSAQSGLGQRRADFSASYEELGGDTDAEYVSRTHARKISSPTLSGPDPEEESEEDEQPGGGQAEAPSDPMTVHESVRRTPTLVHRDPRVKSREGLLAEYGGEADEPVPTSAGTGKGSLDLDILADEPETVMERASSVDYRKSHARQVSSGSAKLLDVSARRPSTDIKTSPPPSPQPPSSRL